MEYVSRPTSSYSSLWVNGSHVTNSNSTASSVSDQRITLGNVRERGDSEMEIYAGITEGAWSYKGRDNENAMS